jgi:hypothetical protein
MMVGRADPSPDIRHNTRDSFLVKFYDQVFTVVNENGQRGRLGLKRHLMIVFIL